MIYSSLTSICSRCGYDRHRYFTLEPLWLPEGRCVMPQFRSSQNTNRRRAHSRYPPKFQAFGLCPHDSMCPKAPLLDPPKRVSPTNCRPLVEVGPPFKKASEVFWLLAILQGIGFHLSLVAGYRSPDRLPLSMVAGRWQEQRASDCHSRAGRRIFRFSSSATFTRLCFIGP